MDSLTPRWRQQGRNHSRTYLSSARAIDITAWQSVNTICPCCLIHGVCVSHWTPPSFHNSGIEMARVLSSDHAISMTSVQRVLDQPVSSKLVYYYSQAWLTVPVYACVFSFFFMTHRSTVLSILTVIKCPAALGCGSELATQPINYRCTFFMGVVYSWYPSCTLYALCAPL